MWPPFFGVPGAGSARPIFTPSHPGPLHSPKLRRVLLPLAEIILVSRYRNDIIKTKAEHQPFFPLNTKLSPIRKRLLPPQHKKGREGFALIASLTLMILLGMIAIGILATISSMNRKSAHVVLQAEARQQALIGLDAAIAELQQELGPDQRVTASSGILKESGNFSRHILGVWNSWSAPLYGQVDGKTIQSTYTEGRHTMFRRWLISSRDRSSMRSLKAVQQKLGMKAPGSRVMLVGEGTLGRSADEEDFVYADLLYMPASGSNTGAFAWWIGGENQKANVSVRDRVASSDPIDILHRTWDTPAPVFTETRSLAFLPTEINEPEKLLTLDTLPLMSRAAMNSGKPYFFDATPFSYTLPVNVRDGGLKHDLNLLLNKRSLSQTEFAPRSDQDCPLAEGESLPVGTETRMPIGSWQVMHAYHNMWPDGSSASGSFAGRLQGNVMQAYTLMSGNLISESTDKGDSVTYFDSRIIENDSRTGYTRAPVLSSFLGCWGISVSLTKYNKGNTLHFAYSPMVMWWNPYNVQMRVGGKKLWAYTLPYRTLCVQTWDDRAILKDPSRPWSPKLMINPSTSDGTQIPWQCCFRIDWGNYFVNSMEDQSGDIIFEPGEILAFTMAGDILSVNEIDSFGTPQEAIFIMGDHPEKMTHFRADYHEYVNLTDPNAGDMYNYYIDRFSARLALENKKTPFFTGNIAYGIASSLANGNNLITMGELRMSAARYTASLHTHTAGREAFAVTYGYDGINTVVSNSAESLAMGQIDRFNGARGISPASFMLGWYDYDNISEGDMTFLDTKWNANMFGNEPLYYVALGIVPKSFNTSFNDGLPKFRGKDFRGKIWQHSSPALWGSALYKPDDQQRQYHPYQLAAIEMGSSIDRGVLDTVNERNGVYGISSVGGGGGEGVSFISVLELPLHPPFSLAGFAGMRLTPGWYETSGSGNQASFARARRMQYQAGVPGVGIGNSFADPCLPANDVYTFHESQISTNFSTNGRIFSDFFDHGFIINDALWDRWFCSSMADVPTKNGRRDVRELVEGFVSGKQDLPVSRYKKTSSPLPQEEIIRKIMDEDGWRVVARYLMIEGGFNVNSVSEDAWTAVLLGLAKRDLVSNAGGTLHKIDKQNSEDVLFSRFMVSTAERSIDGGYNVLEGSANLRPNMKLATAWGEVRALSPDSIRELAKEMVKKVRERGPFLNMADFINRRLDGGSDTALTGALQAAIDATDINAMFKDGSYEVAPLREGSLYRYPKAEEGSMYTAAPGYLIQSDVLASLGNILTVRDDTFIVRAYGCVHNPKGDVLAQAWCEATVQRTMDYIDPSNSAEDAPRTPGDTRARSRKAKDLSDINRLMGRKFRVVSFRWLDHWDI